MHDLIDLRFDRFNEKIKVMSNDIIEALNDPFVKIQIVLHIQVLNYLLIIYKLLMIFLRN